MKYLPLLLLMAGIANASILDGVKDNPDRYISLDLLGVWNHQSSNLTVPRQVNFYANDSQAYHYNDHGVRGVVNVPLDESTTLLLGGNYLTGSYAWDQGQYLIGSNGQVHTYGVEAGLRFYFKP